MQKRKNVFTLKMTVVCLTVKSSFPITNQPQLNHSTENPISLLGKNPMGEERPNASYVFLPTELYMAVIKKMGNLEIGKSAAILDCLNEELYREGLIDRETYEKFQTKYHKKLVEVVREKGKATAKEQPNQQALQVQKKLVMVTEQWETISEKSKLYYVEEARKFRDTIPEAREILRKAGIIKEA